MTAVTMETSNSAMASYDIKTSRDRLRGGSHYMVTLPLYPRPPYRIVLLYVCVSIVILHTYYEY